MKKLLLLLLLIPLLTVQSYAEGVNDPDLLSEVIPEENEKISGFICDDGSYDAGGAVKKLLDDFAETVRTEIRRELGMGAQMAAIALAVSLASVFAGASVNPYINAAGVCALTVLLSGGVDSLVECTADTLYRLSDYSKAAIPAVFTAAAASGAAVSAPAKYAAVCMALDLLMNISHKVVIPLVYSYLALAISSALFDNSILQSGKRIIKWCIVTLMTTFTMIFTAYIGITGIITGSADAMAIKTARTVISSTLPIVGGIISDTASTVLSAANMIKNSAGSIALIAVCVICAEPFAKLLVRSLIFKAGAAICDMTANLRLSPLINDIGTAVNFLMGLVGCTSILLFISFTSAIKLVNA